MHPEIEQDHPGTCPICGMTLEPKVASLQEDNSEYLDMLRRFWVGVILTIPILTLAMVHPLPPKLSSWLQLILASQVVLWAGWPFFKRAWLSIVNRSLNMFSLIAMGVGAAYFYSVFAILFPQSLPDSFKINGEPFIYFEAAATIVVLVLLGQVLELKAKSHTSRAIKALLNRAPKTAHKFVKGNEIDVPIEQVQVDDILRVKPGEKVPVDGLVVEGASFVDESMISGEPIPVEKKADSLVIGGTINQNGSFLMQAQKVGSETILARIVQMVSAAQRSKAPIQRIADEVAAYFVPLVFLAAILTFIVWAIIGPEPRFVYALVNAIAVLIIACPCALGLATPMSIMVGIGRGAEMGILIKNAAALEKLEKVNAIVLDKTGTLTEGKPRMIKIVAAQNLMEGELWGLAASVEALSEHPLAQSIVKPAQERNLPLQKVDNFHSEPGGGVMGAVSGQQIYLGKYSWLEQKGVTGLQEFFSKAQEYQLQAQTVIFMAIDGHAAGFIVVTDPIKKSTPSAIADLHKLGLRVIMLTGDQPNTANAVARSLKIDQFFAGVNPENKNLMIDKLKQQGLVVAMAGDGVNDAPALAAADVGIAMGTGTDVAMESAEVTLVKGDLRGIVQAISLSKATMHNIRQNLFFAFIYNVLGIPIAAGILYPFFGLLLSPMIASAAMALSSVSVILNALRLAKQGK